MIIFLSNQVNGQQTLLSSNDSACEKNREENVENELFYLTQSPNEKSFITKMKENTSKEELSSEETCHLTLSKEIDEIEEYRDNYVSQDHDQESFYCIPFLHSPRNANM